MSIYKVKGGRHYWSSTRTREDVNDAYTVEVGNGFVSSGNIIYSIVRENMMSLCGQ